MLLFKKLGGVVKKSSELVKTFDVEPFQAGDGDTFRFRLEILQTIDEQTFTGKVYRLETYRIQPTFPQSQSVLPDWQNDALIFVADEMFDSVQLSGSSVEEVLAKFKSELGKIFG